MTFQRLNRFQMAALSDNALAEYIQREDAFEASKQGITRAEYISMHKAKIQDFAARAWDEAFR